MDHSTDNTAHHQHPPPLVNELQPRVRRIWLRCRHCDTVQAYDQYLYAAYFQRLQLRCSICRCFNPQWGFRITNELATPTNNNSEHQEWPADWENFEFPDISDGWLFIDADDSNHQELLEDWENFELPESQNSNGGASFERASSNHPLTEEIISMYLFARDRRKSVNEAEECEICVVCQNNFMKGEVSIDLDCGHDYHYECISQWLLRKNSCPLCIRTVIPPDIGFGSD